MRCPVCNSTKFVQTDVNAYCENCNYVWVSSSIQQFSLGPSLWGRWKPPFSDESANFSDKQGKRTLPTESVSDMTTLPCVEIDYHNTAYKFQIIKDNPAAHLPNRRRMRGWTEEWLDNERAEIRRTTKSLVVYLRGRVKTSIGNTWVVGEQFKQVAIEEAQKVAQSLGIEIGQPEPVRKEIKVCEPFVQGVQVQTDLFKMVYPTGEVEFIDKKDAERHVINFVKNMASVNALPEKLDTLTFFMNQFGQQLQVHLGAVKNLGGGVERLCDVIEPVLKKKTVFARFKAWLGL